MDVKRLLYLVIYIFVLILRTICAAMETHNQDYTVYEKTMVLESGLTLRYTLALPPSLFPDQSCPLVLALHYGGRVTPYYGKGFLTQLVLPALRDLGAIMIAPDCPAEGWTNPISEQAVLALVQAVRKEYRIDDGRLLITGYSMGATGTWDYVFKHPGLFSAAIPVSGMPPKGTILKAPGTMILAIHSRDDELFPLDSLRKFIRTCQSQKIPVELRVVAGLSHYHFDQFVRALRETVPRVKALWESPSTPTSTV